MRRLIGRRSARLGERVFVVEGATVVSEALAAGVPLEAVYVGPGAPATIEKEAEQAGVSLVRLQAGVMERVASVVTPQPVLAVAPFVDVPLDSLRGADLIMVLADVRDPGNAGTIVRTAEAAGAGGVVCCAGAVDLYSPKTVRASAGSLFHVPVVAGGSPVEVLEAMASWGMQRLATVASGGVDYAEVDLTGPTAIVLGNEAHGLPVGLETLVDRQISIPMAGRTESLNVSMAAAVLCFEAARQRRGRMGS